MDTDPIAAPELHRYASGRLFYIVECRRCLVALNSGHHYSAEHLGHAHRLADEHNRERHAAQPACSHVGADHACSR